MLNVVPSKYTFDEQVLIYEKYEDLLHDIQKTINKYYEFRAKTIWGTIAAASSAIGFVTLLLAVYYANNYLYVSMNLSLLGLVLSIVAFIISILKKESLYNKYIRLKRFLDSEQTDINFRDGEIRTLRLVERKGYKNIRRIERKGSYCYVYFDNTVYNKPCALDSSYFNKGTSTLDLSVFDSYYDDVETRMTQLTESNTLHNLEKVLI